MLSAVIPSEHSYPAMRLASQPVHQRFVHSGPLVLGADPLKFPAPTVDRDRTVSRRSKPSSRTSLNGEQPYPPGPASAPGWDEPTSRCQTPPSIWTLGRYRPVIPRVPFIRWAMALPYRTTGSLRPTFVPARLVGLAVKRAFAFILYAWFPTAERTFVLLRYSLGGDRPRSNYPPDMVLAPDNGAELEPQHYQGGISRTAPSD